MNVLVMVGTQKQQFIRLFEMTENSSLLEGQDVVEQVGNTKFDSKKFKTFPFIENEEVKKLIEKSDLIICHGGVGTIFEGLHKEKKVLAVPRLKKYGEHVDDHQLEICDELENNDYIVVCRDGDNLDDKISEILSKNLKKYARDENFLEVLRKEI